MHGALKHRDLPCLRRGSSSASRARQKSHTRLAVQPGVSHHSGKPLTREIGQHGRDDHRLEVFVADALDCAFVAPGLHKFAACEKRCLLEDLEQSRLVVNEKESKARAGHLPPQARRDTSHDTLNCPPVKRRSAPMKVGSIGDQAGRLAKLLNWISRPVHFTFKKRSCAGDATKAVARARPLRVNLFSLRTLANQRPPDACRETPVGTIDA